MEAAALHAADAPLLLAVDDVHCADDPRAAGSSTPPGGSTHCPSSWWRPSAASTTSTRRPPAWRTRSPTLVRTTPSPC
ncbi:hypothetical protein O1M63_02040 [Streptomyces mirabilis]|nr:hypothetical protein [Streptomyces mirabilis]